MVEKFGDAFEKKYYNLIPNRNEWLGLSNSYENSIKIKRQKDATFDRKWRQYAQARYSSFFRLVMSQDQIQRLKKMQSDVVDSFIENGIKGVQFDILYYRELIEAFYCFLYSACSSLCWEIDIICLLNSKESQVGFGTIKSKNMQIKPFIEKIETVLDRRQHIAHYWLQLDVGHIIAFLYKDFTKGTLWDEVEKKWKECLKEISAVSIPKDRKVLISHGMGQEKAGIKYVYDIEEIANKHGFIRSEKQLEEDSKIVIDNFGEIYKILKDSEFPTFVKSNNLSK